jgi:hypothetical protein
MNNPNERQQIPPARPEIIAEIVAVDCLLADLFLKCQDNAREVDQLIGVMENHLASCEDVRDSLLNLRVEHSNPPGLTMIDLPIFEQRMIVSTGLFSKMLLDALQLLTKSDVALLKEKLIQQVNIDVSSFSDSVITQILKDYLRKHQELVNEHNKLVSKPDDNN